jgi:Fe(II)/alpha-ketoglutarate-dependent arginine beta-hydroxylase
MENFVLTHSEIDDIRKILQDVASRYSSVENPEFLREASLYAHALPYRVRKYLNDFKLLEGPPGCRIISGYPINEEKIGSTPVHWKINADNTSTLEEEVLLVLFGCLLGEPLAWATQQDGRIVHDILPIRGNEQEQLGTGSEQPLWWHTEDAFHPYRGDYLGMMCLRNVDQVATTFASIDTVRLDPDLKDLLLQEGYSIRPDESHLEKNKAESSKQKGSVLETSYRKMARLNSNPEKVAVLFGDPQCPYLRIDPYFMDRTKDDPAAERALNHLISALNTNLCDLVLQPGDFCFIDNYKAVHGRKPFKARYDGRDRWLKRINIARDLRKSRNARISSESRVII